MSKKRFLLDKVEKGNAILSVKITDSVSDNNYFIMTKDFYEDDIDEIVDCLNGQQTTISQLKEENEQLKQEVFVYKKAFQEQVQRCTL